MDRLEEVLTFLGIPHFLSIPEWEQEDWIRQVQQNRRDFRPKVKKENGLDFGPPQLSDKQMEVISGMDIGVEYHRGDLACSISTLRSLLNKGMVETDGEEEIWRRLENEWI